jgi:hypothetical protein
MKIINLIAAMCSIIALGFAFWWAYVTAVYDDKHKVIAFILALAVVGMSAIVCIVLFRASQLASSKLDRPPTKASRDPFNNPQLEIVSNKKFRNEGVELDGKRFYDCEFINTRLIFHGIAPTELLGDCKIGGSVVLETDNQPAMHYAHLMRIISSIPHIGEAFLSVDDKGNARPIVNEAKIEKAQLGLRERTFALCKQLRAFLDEHNDRPNEDLIPIDDKDEFVRRYNSEIQPWDDKFRATYWRRFREQTVNIRHELAESRLTDEELDVRLTEADTSNLCHSTVSAINDRLRYLASKLD